MWTYTFILLTIYPGIELMQFSFAELLLHITDSVFSFGETYRLFSKGAAPLYILTSSAGMSQFLHILTHTVVICLFYYSSPSGCEVASHSDLMCISMITVSIFQVLIGHFDVFF